MLHNWNVKLFFAAVGLSSLLYGMEMPKTDVTKADLEEFITSAERGYFGGVKKWLYTIKGSINAQSDKNGRTALVAAARNGRAELVDFLLKTEDLRRNKADTEIADKAGLTALAWATIERNKEKNDQSNYMKIAQALLKAQANFRAKDNQGKSILHHAAGSGDPEMIKFIYMNGGKNDINDAGPGRTPLAEAVRAAGDALVHVPEFEKQDFKSPQELEAYLDQAIVRLNQKVKEKLSTYAIVQAGQTLRQLGASNDLVDASGKSLGYYINEVQLISEMERVGLLKALGLPVEARLIRYTEKDLSQAVSLLEILDKSLQQFDIGSKINAIIWTIQAAQKEQNRERKYNILRLAMGLISLLKDQVKERSKEKAKDLPFLKYVEENSNIIRTVLRDAALTISGKVPLDEIKPMAVVPPAPVVQKPQQAAQPLQQTATVILPKAAVLEQTEDNSIYFGQIENKSDQPVVLTITHGDKSPMIWNIYHGRADKPFVRIINLTINPRGGLSTMMIKSKKGAVTIEVTDALRLVWNGGQKQLEKNKYKKTNIVVYSDGFIELVPVTP